MKTLSARCFPRTALLSALLGQTLPAAAQFSVGEVTGWTQGAPGSSGGTTYPFPNPYMPATLAPPPEISGNYSVQYLFSPATGQTYADPMFYHGLRALGRWDAIEARSRAVTRPARRTMPRPQPSAAPPPGNQAPAPAPPLAPLTEVIEK